MVQQTISGNQKAVANLIALLKRKGVDLRVTRNVAHILAAVSDPWIPGCQYILEADEDLSALLLTSQSDDLESRRHAFTTLLNLSKSGDGARKLIECDFLRREALNPSREDSKVVSAEQAIRQSLTDFEARRQPNKQ